MYVDFPKGQMGSGYTSKNQALLTDRLRIVVVSDREGNLQLH